MDVARLSGRDPGPATRRACLPLRHGPHDLDRSERRPVLPWWPGASDRRQWRHAPVPPTQTWNLRQRRGTACRVPQVVRVFGCAFGALTETRLRRWQLAAPTYRHIGSTLRATADAGHEEHRLIVGDGEADFDAAAEALDDFVPQRAVGARVRPPGVRPDLGESVILSVGVGRVSLLVPTRVVAVVDEPARRGYAYGTLPGHPESGEELFLVELANDGTVSFIIRIDARPIRQLRLLAGVIRVVQRIATARYLSAVARSVASSRTD